MKRIVLVVVIAYLLAAAATRLAEHFGLRSCGCAEHCWCHRPGLSLFRWVVPWGHRPAHTSEEKADF